MEEPQRARSQTVTTTASSFAENFSTTSSSFSYDREFLRTLPGLLIVAEIVLGLLVWTLIAGTEYFRVPAFGWVMFVAVFYWVLTVFFLIIYLTMTYTRIPQVPWTTVGLWFNGSAFALYLSAAIVDASSVSPERDSHNFNSWAASSATLLIAFICVRSSLWTSYSAYSYFEVVTICNLIMILAFYLAHLFRLPRVLTCISWPLSELLHYLIGTLLLLIASIVAASKSYSQSGLVAGAVFGFLATFLCLASVWLSYKISCVTQSTDAA
uniref:CKLF like MARVEL transmembrane domain containing 8 n=1 Tax=Bos indicus x Bos taurus TaxID=30522 RepID=A0A4W2BSE3_BOBOX